MNSNSPEAVEQFIERQLPMGKFGWPEPVGEMVAFLCSERADLVTGTSVTVDGGQSRSLISRHSDQLASHKWLIEQEKVARPTVLVDSLNSQTKCNTLLRCCHGKKIQALPLRAV